MTLSLRFASFTCILAMTALWGPNAQADINVLIVDGFSNHSVEKTTHKIKDILAGDPNFVVSVSTMPAIDSEEWSSWDPNFAAYDVIIQTCNNLNKREISWPDNVKAGLESYIRGGGGMYVYHGGNNSFPEWPEYNKMIGMGWRPVDYGKAVHVVDGRLEEIPAGVGKKTGHGPRLDAVVHQFGDHPIHANLPRSWKSADLEVYAYARGPLENLTVLSYAREPVNDMDFPIEWSVAYGAGRTYVSTYGHFWHNQEDPPGMRDVAFHTLMKRALQWLAKKPVTKTVPANFPTDITISLQDAPPTLASAAGSTTLSTDPALPTILSKRGKLILDDNGSMERGGKTIRSFDNGVSLKSALGIWERSETDAHVWRSTDTEGSRHPPVLSYPGVLANNLIVEVTFRYGENTEPWHNQFLRIAADQRPQINGHIVSAWVNLNARYTPSGFVLEHVPGKTEGGSRGTLLDHQPLAPEPGAWHTAILEIVDDETLFRMGDHVAYAKTEEITIPKNLVSLTLGTTWHEIKRVRIWHAEPNPNWEANKKAILQSREPFTPRPR